MKLPFSACIFLGFRVEIFHILAKSYGRKTKIRFFFNLCLASDLCHMHQFYLSSTHKPSVILTKFMT